MKRRPLFTHRRSAGLPEWASLGLTLNWSTSGSSAGFGIRLVYDAANQRLLIAEAYESAPAFAAGIDRGTAIVAIGTTSGNLQTVNNLMARVAKQLTDEEIQSLGSYVQGLHTRTAGTSKPAAGH